MKKIMFLRLCLFFFVVGVIVSFSVGNSFAAIVGARNETQLVVLCYHHINSTLKTPYTLSDVLFKKQLEALTAQGYRFVSMQEVDDYYYQNKPFPSKAALVTFDDANRSVYTIAYPYLRAHNIPWALFVYPTAIRSVASHGFMSWGEIKEVSEHGATIGSHSYWHPYLTDYAKEKNSDSWLNTQITESRKVLESHINKPVQTFAIPFGLWDKTVYDRLKIAGYRIVFNVNNSNNNQDSDPMNLNRQMIGAGEAASYFNSRITTKRLNLSELQPQNLAVVQSPAVNLRIAIPNAQKYKVAELYLREPRWGKLPLVLKNGRAELEVNLTQSGQYIPHVYAHSTSGDAYEDSWSFVYRKVK